jgi:hypothetical protein
MRAVQRLIAGEDPALVACEFNVDVAEVLRWKSRVEALMQRQATREARRRAVRGQLMREAEVEKRVRRHLADQGYLARTRSKPTGPDIVAERDGRTLLVEAKGDRPGHDSNSGTINVDVMTLLGQIVMAKAVGDADDYAIAVRPVHTRLIEKAMPVLRELRVSVMLVNDDSIQLMGTPADETHAEEGR